jgi:ABC-2 type transport system ATP-binding protein
MPEAPLLAAGFRHAAEGAFLIDAKDAADLNAALERARLAGALLVDLRRASRDLEQVLTETLRNSA